MRRNRSLLLLVSLLLFARTAEGAQTQATHKPLLMITSYHHGDRWDDSVTQGVREGIGSSGEIELSIENLDMRRRTEKEHEQRMINYIQEKYQGRPLDLIIVSDDAALDFLLKVRASLFPSIPVVFCGINNFTPSRIAGQSGLTGVKEEVSTTPTLDLALQLFPETTRIAAVVSDFDANSRTNLAHFRKVAREYKGHIQLVELLNMTGEDAPEILGALPEKSLVLRLTSLLGPAGGILSLQESMEQISMASPVPVLTVWDFDIGVGALGGVVISGLEQGRKAGELAVRILAGEDPDTIPVIMTSPNIPMFDHRVLERFGMSAASLPKGSRVINRRFSAYEQYRAWIWAGIVATTLLSVMVVSLLISVIRQREAVLALQANERKFKELIRNSSDSVTILDRNGQQLFVSEVVEKILGFTPAELINIPVIETMIHPEDQSRVMSAFQTILSSGFGIVQYRHRHKNGGWIDLEAWGSNQLENPDIRGVVVNVRNITERNKAEESLRQNENNLRVTLDSIAEAVITTDINGRITRMNPVAERLTGYPREEADGRSLSEVFCTVDPHSRKSVRDPVERVLKEDQAGLVSAHSLLRARDGQEYLIDVSAAPIRSGSGAITGIVLTFRDVTSALALQEKLLQSQKLDALGQLAGGIAHDFNNMLGGIMGTAELLQLEVSHNPKCMKWISLLMDTVTRATSLTEKLLTFGRRQAVTYVSTDIHQVIRAANDLLVNSVDKRIRIEEALNATECRVLGDAPMLQSVFLNLGINASHAMPEGGVITFTSEVIECNEDCSAATGQNLEPGLFIEIRVDDTGCGIPPEFLSRIFEPFFTTKKQGKGTGLGLSAALGTLLQHKGAITVTSEVGRGTSFRVLLPLTSSAVPPKLEPLDMIPGNGMILLVDDESVLRMSAAALLTQAGYHVLCAEDGEEALSIYRERHQEIDLIILDMIMPNLNGRDCFHALRRIRSDARIILASGFSEVEDLDKLKTCGLAGFIHKPFHSAELYRLVASAMASGGCKPRERLS